MNKILGLVAILVLGFFAWNWWKNQSTSEIITPPAIEEPKTEDIIVTTPTEGATVTSPLSITGQAVGTWFWEGSFPVEITNDAGIILGTGFVMNEPGTEWMTEELVPFVGEIQFQQPADATAGKLIVRKANASGLPEHDAEVTVRVVFE